VDLREAWWRPVIDNLSINNKSYLIIPRSTYYDGKQFISRLGNPFTPPNWFLDSTYAKFPFNSYITFQTYNPLSRTSKGRRFRRRALWRTRSIPIYSLHCQNRKLGSLEEHHLSGTSNLFATSCDSVAYTYYIVQIFDVPSRGEETFEDRYKFLEENFGENGKFKTGQIVVVEHERATSRDHVLEKLKEIESLGGEGLMLRKPGSYVPPKSFYGTILLSTLLFCRTYEGRRSGSLLKIKVFRISIPLSLF